MKPHYLMMAMLLGGGLATQSQAQFNTDALNKMQQAGHKIVAESKGARAYKFGKDLCLDAAGGLSVNKCDARIRTQQWITDEKERLVSDNGQCLAAGRLAQCSTADIQIWEHDDKGRLANKAKQCLQVQGTPVRAGSKVVAAACSAAASQVWTVDPPTESAKQ